MISPKCDAAKLRLAILEANDIAYVAREDGLSCYASSSESQVGSRRAMVLRRSGATLLYDEICSPPIFNYSRIFSWSMCVEQVADAFQGATEHAESKEPADPDREWKFVKDAADTRMVHAENRKGSKSDVINYCKPSEAIQSSSIWGQGVFKRIAVASFMGLLLQWCTAGAAVIIVIFTPTTGLGCRSGSYILYGLGSTAVWFMMVSSSILGHYSTMSIPELGAVTKSAVLEFSRRRVYRAATLPLQDDSSPSPLFQRLAGSLAVFLNALGKIIGALNALWIVCTCFLHFTNVFNRCFCNSSVYGHGVERAYNVLALTAQDKVDIQHVWVGGVAMTLISSGLFTGLIWMYHRPPQPKN